MTEAYVTVEAPNATKLAEMVEDIPIRDGFVNEKLGGGPSVTVHSDALDDAEEMLDDIVEYSSVKPSQISID